MAKLAFGHLTTPRASGGGGTGKAGGSCGRDRGAGGVVGLGLGLAYDPTSVPLDGLLLNALVKLAGGVKKGTTFASHMALNDLKVRGDTGPARRRSCGHGKSNGARLAALASPLHLAFAAGVNERAHGAFSPRRG